MRKWEQSDKWEHSDAQARTRRCTLFTALLSCTYESEKSYKTEATLRTLCIPGGSRGKACFGKLPWCTVQRRWDWLLRAIVAQGYLWYMYIGCNAWDMGSVRSEVAQCA